MNGPPHRLRDAGLAVAGLVVTAVLVASISIMWAGPPEDAAPVPRPVDVNSVFFTGCGEQAVVEPSTVPLWCASTDQRLENLAWVSWGGVSSLATGILTDNSCDCSAGKVATYPVEVGFSQPTTVGVVGRYQRLSITFASERPLWATRATMHFLWGDLGFVSDQTRP